MIVRRLLLLCTVLFISCTSAEVKYDIEASRLSNDGEHIEALLSVEHYQSSCRFGGHGCTTKTEDRALYYVSLPLQIKTYSIKYIKQHWQLVHSVTNKFPYRQYFIGDKLIGEMVDWKALNLCQLSSKGCKLLPSLNHPVTKQVGDLRFLPGQAGHYLLAGGYLFNLSDLHNGTDLNTRENYRNFIIESEKYLGDSVSHRILPLSLHDGRYVVATSRFTAADNTLMAMIYDIEKDTVKPVHWQLQRSNENISARRVYWYQGEFYFLVNLFAYEGTEKTLDSPHLYAATAGKLIDIASFYHDLKPPVWNADKQRFIILNWRQGIELTEIPFKLVK